MKKNIGIKIVFGVFDAGLWLINSWYNFPDWVKHQKSKLKKKKTESQTPAD